MGSGGELHGSDAKDMTPSMNPTFPSRQASFLFFFLRPCTAVNIRWDFSSLSHNHGNKGAFHQPRFGGFSDSTDFIFGLILRTKKLILWGLVSILLVGFARHKNIYFPPTIPSSLHIYLPSTIPSSFHIYFPSTAISIFLSTIHFLKLSCLPIS